MLKIQHHGRILKTPAPETDLYLHIYTLVDGSNSKFVVCVQDKDETIYDVWEKDEGEDKEVSMEEFASTVENMAEVYGVDICRLLMNPVPVLTQNCMCKCGGGYNIIPYPIIGDEYKKTGEFPVSNCLAMEVNILEDIPSLVVNFFDVDKNSKWKPDYTSNIEKYIFPVYRLTFQKIVIGKQIGIFWVLEHLKEVNGEDSVFSLDSGIFEDDKQVIESFKNLGVRLEVKIKFYYVIGKDGSTKEEIEDLKFTDIWTSFQPQEH